MTNLEVVVLGGGPAGCATALTLKRMDPALSIALLEKSDYQAVRIGETLPPVVQDVLNQLGVWTAFLDIGPLEAHGTRACWGSEEPLENEFLFYPQGRGWHVHRGKFDAMLAAAARDAGVDFHGDTRVQSVERHSDGWRVAADKGLKIECRYLVDATGRNSVVAAQQAKHILYDHLLGCFQFFESKRCVDSYTLVEACEKGWTYSATLPDGGMVAAFFSDADILRNCAPHGWLALLDQAPHTRRRLAGARPTSPPSIHSARSQQIETCTGDGWIAVGDAASTFDPLSSQGIYKALRSGIFAAYAILDARKGNGAEGFAKVQRFVREEYNDYLDARSHYYAQEQRWPDAPFWKRRHESITLDPALLLYSGTGASLSGGMHLTADETALILGLCTAPRAAHDVVREFTSRAGRPIPHRRAVLALQYLLDRGVIRRWSHAAEESPVHAQF